MYLVRTPALLKPLFRDLIWSMPTDRKEIYITFDDGPIPEVTPWVLETLQMHKALATFFVLGKNAAANPTLLDRIRAEGHTVGNHTWDHLNGWKTAHRTYLRNVLRVGSLGSFRLFRPPYGRITRAQANALRDRFEVVMWDVLSADFDPAVSGERCLQNVTSNAGPGSIVVFHDSLKAEPRLRFALPRVLEHFAEQGYVFKALPPKGVKAERK